MTMIRSKNSTCKLLISGQYMILRHTIYFFIIELQWNFDMSDLWWGHILFSS
jgi:hypothetical protein